VVAAKTMTLLREIRLGNNPPAQLKFGDSSLDLAATLTLIVSQSHLAGIRRNERLKAV
jgi:hypothetical protein